MVLTVKVIMFNDYCNIEVKNENLPACCGPPDRLHQQWWVRFKFDFTASCALHVLDPPQLTLQNSFDQESTTLTLSGSTGAARVKVNCCINLCSSVFQHLLWSATTVSHLEAAPHALTQWRPARIAMMFVSVSHISQLTVSSSSLWTVIRS